MTTTTKPQITDIQISEVEVSESGLQDRLTELQHANAFLQHCVSSGEGFELTTDQQLGAKYFFQKIINELEHIKTIAKKTRQ